MTASAGIGRLMYVMDDKSQLPTEETIQRLVPDLLEKP
jgi:hypothetical protein